MEILLMLLMHIWENWSVLTSQIILLQFLLGLYKSIVFISWSKIDYSACIYL